MVGVKGRSGRKIGHISSLDKVLSFADQVALRAIKDESIPLIERGRLAMQITLKKMVEKKESVVVNLTVSDEVVERLLARLDHTEAITHSSPPPDVYVEVIEDTPSSTNTIQSPTTNRHDDSESPSP